MRGEVVRTFDESIEGPRGRTYVARICGRSDGRGQWEGWIEFVPREGEEVLRTDRETVQSNRRAFQGWADRLTLVYLEGALTRALDRDEPRPVRVAGSRPLSRGVDAEDRRGFLAPDDAPLNPILAFRRGEDVLRRKLGRLSLGELRALVRAYNLPVDVEALVPAEAMERIVAAVGERTTRG